MCAYSFAQYETFSKWPPGKLGRTRAGYAKLEDFIRRFVKGGGIVRAGSDPRNGMPAMGVHQELKMFVEAGLTPPPIAQRRKDQCRQALLER